MIHPFFFVVLALVDTRHLVCNSIQVTRGYEVFVGKVHFLFSFVLVLFLFRGGTRWGEATFCNVRSAKEGVWDVQGILLINLTISISGERN